MNKVALLLLLAITFSLQAQESETLIYKTSLLSAHQHFKNKDYQQALTAYQYSYQQESLVSTLYNIAICHFKLKQWRQALSAFEQLQAEPDNPELIDYNIAVTQKKLGFNQAAKTTFNYLKDYAENDDLALLAEQQLLQLNDSYEQAQQPHNNQQNNTSNIASNNKASLWQHVINVQAGNESNIVLPDDESYTEQSDQFIDYLLSSSWLSNQDLANAWLLDFTYYGSKYSAANSYEISMYALSARKFYTPKSLTDLRLYLGASFDSIDLAGNSYLDTTNFKLGGQYALTDQQKIKLDFIYRNIAEGAVQYDYLAGNSTYIKLSWQQYLTNGYWNIGAKYQSDNKKDRYLEDEFISYSADRISFFTSRHWQYNQWEFDLTAEYRLSKYHDNNTFEGAVDTLREDDKLFMGSSLAYNLIDNLSLNASFEFTNNASTLAENEYDQSTFSVGVTWLY
ncbi:MAG: tetratricopeptide repeat protein [Thalassotalea sp.]